MASHGMSMVWEAIDQAMANEDGGAEENGGRISCRLF